MASNNCNKSIVQLSLDGEFIREWDMITEAANEIGTTLSNISCACRGKSQTAGGFRWYYKEDYLKNKDRIKPLTTCFYNGKRIIQLTKDYKFIKEWESLTEATNDLNLKQVSSISSALKKRNKTAGGYIWMYKEDYEKLCC